MAEVSDPLSDYVVPSHFGIDKTDCICAMLKPTKSKATIGDHREFREAGKDLMGGEYPVGRRWHFVQLGRIVSLLCC